MHASGVRKRFEDAVKTHDALFTAHRLVEHGETEMALQCIKALLIKGQAELWQSYLGVEAAEDANTGKH